MLLRLLRLLNKKLSQFMLFCCGLVSCLLLLLLVVVVVVVVCVCVVVVGGGGGGGGSGVCVCVCVCFVVVVVVAALLLLFSSAFYLKSLCRKSLKKLSAIPSCSRYLAGVILKLRLNSWSTKYPQNVTCICTNALSVNHILLLLLPKSYFKKMGMTLLFVTM